jgi:serine protease AprX
VSLAVYNTLGQRIKTLVNGEQEAGYHELQFKADGLASGLYIYRLETETGILTQRMVMVR